MSSLETLLCRCDNLLVFFELQMTEHFHEILDERIVVLGLIVEDFEKNVLRAGVGFIRNVADFRQDLHSLFPNGRLNVAYARNQYGINYLGIAFMGFSSLFHELRGKFDFG